MAAGDFLLKIGSLDGEANDDEHKNWIDVHSWSFGESNAGSNSFGSGGGTGKVAMQDFHFTMTTQKCSPDLFLACATGEHYSEATLVCRKAGGTALTYFKVVFSDCLVSSFQTGGSDGGGLPMDSISLNFAKIQLNYQEQDSTTGKAKGGLVKQTYDLKLNKKV